MLCLNLAPSLVSGGPHQPDYSKFCNAYTACLICCPVLAADLLQSVLPQRAHNMLHGISMHATCYSASS